MTIIVYSCNPDISLSANSKLASPKSPNAQNPLPFPQTPSTTTNYHRRLSQRQSLIIQQDQHDLKSTSNENIAINELTTKNALNMTKSPLGSQIDITQSGKKLVDQNELDDKFSGGNTVGNFFKNHLRNTSPSKDQQKSPRLSRKSIDIRGASCQLDSSPITNQSAPRHGSFSSPFKMPKFSSNKSDQATDVIKSDTNLISTATSALRRLHFKSGRNASAKVNQQRINTASNVPKVIVMGSSSTSETTINTSTDSANTIITTMTNTDEYLTEDSLDKPEVSLRTDKLIDFDSDISRAHKEPNESISESTYLFKDDQINNEPKTALFYEQKFIFDTEPQPKSPKYASKTTESKFNFDSLVLDESKKIDFLKTPAELKRRQSENLEKTKKSSHQRTHSRRRRQSSPRNELRNSDDVTKSNLKSSTKKKVESKSTTRLPDLRVDFFSNSTDTTQTNSITNATCLNQCLRDVGARLECALTPCSNGALLGGDVINVTTNPLDPSNIHLASQNKATIVVQQPSLSLDSTNIATVLLKNGVDFVSNVSNISATDCLSKGASTSSANLSHKSSKRQKQREENMKQLLEVANTLTLEELHDFEMRYGSPHHSRSQSVKTPGRSSNGRPNYLCLPQQRSRVASMPNTGVEEEYYRLRHFSITGKGVVNRGDSLKSRRSRSNNSVASSNSSTEHLQTQPGPASYPGSARTSVSSRESSNASQTGGVLIISGIGSGVGTSGTVQAYRVAMLGSAGVGKSSLVSQFMTSEYLHAYDTSIDDDSGEKSVSVLLAGQESELTFIDLPYAEQSPENVTGTYSASEEPNAYCVVYSCADRSSLQVAERALAHLWTSGLVASKAVILVANKTDLVRSRVITTDEGKTIATQYDCKFIETSVGINHNVDELLVGILTQIRLKLENPEKTRDLFRKRSSSKKTHRNKSPHRSLTSALTSCSGGGNSTGPNQTIATDDDINSTISNLSASNYCWGGTHESSAPNTPKKYRGTRTSASLKVRGLLGKVWARDSKSKSCENLHVL